MRTSEGVRYGSVAYTDVATSGTTAVLWKADRRFLGALLPYINLFSFCVIEVPHAHGGVFSEGFRSAHLCLARRCGHHSSLRTHKFLYPA